jgi:hypothetical protein
VPDPLILYGTRSDGSTAPVQIDSSGRIRINGLGDKGDKGDPGDPGDKGDPGDSGEAATVAVGNVTTGAAGSAASVTNSGTPSDAVLEFEIPRGDKGDKGDPGDPGEAADISAVLSSTYTSVNVSYSETIDINFTADTGKMLVIGTLAGNLTFTFSNVVQGKMVNVDILCDSTQRNLTFPAGAKFLGGKPSSIAASKAAHISFTVTRSPSSSTDDSAVRIAYGVQG